MARIGRFARDSGEDGRGWAHTRGAGSRWCWWALAMVLILVPARLRAGDDGEAPLPPRGLARIGTNDLRTHGFIMSLAFSPDGRLIAVGDADAPGPRVALFDVRTGRRVKQLVAPGTQMVTVESVAFSPDGSKLLWGQGNGGVALWDLAGERLLFCQELHNSRVTDVAFSPDGVLMASAAGDAIHLRRVARPEEALRDLWPRAVPRPPEAGGARVLFGGDAVRLAFTPDGSRLIAANWATAMIGVWRVSDGRLLRAIGPVSGLGVNTVSVTPDGRRVVSAGSREVPKEETKVLAYPAKVSLAEVRLWDLETGERLRDFHGRRSPAWATRPSLATAGSYWWRTPTSFASSTPPRAGPNGRSPCRVRGAFRRRSRRTGASSPCPTRTPWPSSRSRRGGGFITTRAGPRAIWSPPPGLRREIGS